MKTLTITVLATLCATSTAFSMKLKVPGNHATIQSAVLSAGPGDVIEISEGVYHEEVAVFFRGYVTLRAKGNDKVVIDGSGTGMPLWVNMSPGVVLKNLRVQNTTKWGGILVTASDNTEVTGCRVNDVALDGILFSLSNWCTARNCVVTDVGGYGISVAADNCLVTGSKITAAGQAGISAYGTQNTIEKNTVKAPVGAGIALGTVSDPCVHALVADNKIYDAGNCGIIAAIMASYCTIVGNTVKRCVANGIHLAGGTQHVEKNLIQSPYTCGIVVQGPQTTLVNNKVRKTAIEGIHLMWFADHGSLTKNDVKKSGTFGFQLAPTVSGNTLLKNKASKSGQYDLKNMTAFGSNAFHNNSFKTVAP